ncbi:MAG: hypothetical protein ACLPUT_05910 [Solirubrobacteraceae bacterium]
MTSQQLYVASSGVDAQPALAMAETAQPSADQQRFRFVLPRLYTFAPDVMGRVFHSHLGAHRIEIRVPDSPRHGIQPGGKTGLGSGAEWVVPRWLELAGPAALNLEGPEIHTQLKAWWRRTTDWLAAWLGAPAGADIPLERLALSLDDHASDDSSPRGVMQFYGFDGETHATSEELARALEFAGTSAELPTAYILLVRGESAYAQRDMRLAVIEACGAAEVAAAVAIEQALAERYGCPADFVRAVARGARGIRRAHETIAQLGVACGAEKSAIEELAKLRNSAVHAGRPVEDPSAGRALVIARSMVTTILGQAAPSPEATT